MPHDLPPKSAAYYYFAAWRDDGTDEKIHDLLRWQVREKAGRSADPTATALDAQSLHAAVNVPAATTGMDVAKRVPGRKRGLAVDVIGLCVAVSCGVWHAFRDGRSGSSCRWWVCWGSAGFERLGSACPARFAVS
ncbi:hypothetical protein GCM10009839_17590 [Catenulispora yoronensis]|uniref:Transposase n=1 Tax=Catenulispora yoronensis TaxID=450799 RepID=A0ABN2TUM3_9ACTN